jgi:para-aminobenzoate synthetase / 4-amino-4-deoxychorismate lyase
MARAIFEGDAEGATRDDWRFSSDSPTTVLIAHRLAEVLPLLKSVEDHVASGAYAVVMLSYEAAPVFDRALTTHQPGDFPVAWAAIFARPQPQLRATTGDYSVGPWQPLVTRSQYEQSIAQIRELIAKGRTYQVNYTFPLVSEFEGDPLGWYVDLRRAQTAPYSAYLDLGRYKLLCLSPELFFRRQGKYVTAMPMKGTARRGRWPAEDEQIAHRLSVSEKDRAENVMIVDLLRNDLGKISVPGTVRASRLFELQRYETLWQMTSTIESELAPAMGLVDILAALFPCGSITGAPKVSTMQIIRELEPFPRHVFTGTIGLIRPGGDCCFNVAIRTVLLDSVTGRATFGVGGGVTFDSTAKGEYEECLTKAAFLTQKIPKFELLESMLLEQGEFFLLDRHLERLRASSEYFGCQFDEKQLRNALEEAAKTHDTGCWKMRLRQSKDGRFETDLELLPSQNGVTNDKPHDLNLLSGSWAGRPCHVEVPLRVKLAGSPINSADKFLFHKTTNRSRYDELLASVSGCDDVLLWNQKGEVTESSIANLVISVEGKLYTPVLESGLLPGTFRAELLEQGMIHERTISKEDLQHARSFYLINSVRKWMPAVLVD